MTPTQAVDIVTCPVCWSPPGRMCVFQSSAHTNPPRMRMHYARWTFMLGLNHDPGDEDRS